MTLGRTAMAADAFDEATGPVTEPADKEKVEAARKSLLDSLTPWIPGDFVISYGALLTAWARLRGSFPGLIIIAAASSGVFVYGAAFAETGFTTRKSRQWKRLSIRTAVGAVVSVLAAVAIPNSGWYDFKAFVDNELSWIVTAGIIVTAVIFVLKGAQKRWKLSFGA
jgi:hypothetical protein